MNDRSRQPGPDKSPSGPRDANDPGSTRYGTNPGSGSNEPKHQGKPAGNDREREIPTPKLDRGMRETDDHVMGQAPRGEAQPVDDLDRRVADEHLRSRSQGVRPER